MTFKDVSGKLPSTAVLATSVSRSNRMVICPSGGHALRKHKPEDVKRRTLKRTCASNKVAVETKR